MLAEKIKLEDDERIIKYARKHWYVLFARIFTLGILAVFPLIVFVLISIFATDFIINLDVKEYINIFIFLYIIWLLILWMILFHTWTDYYLDVWTVTNKRLIAVDQNGLFHRTIGSFRLEKLQDINVDIKGFVATMLDFGTVELETASGSEDEFKMYGLPHPQELKATIFEASDKLMKKDTKNHHGDYFPDDY